MSAALTGTCPAIEAASIMAPLILVLGLRISISGDSTGRFNCLFRVPGSYVPTTSDTEVANL